MPGHRPSFVSTSLWHTPQACTLMRTCPVPRLGISRSTIWKPDPGLEICATFIVVTATVVVAINPPTNRQLFAIKPESWRPKQLDEGIGERQIRLARCSADAREFAKHRECFSLWSCRHIPRNPAIQTLGHTFEIGSGIARQSLRVDR